MLKAIEINCETGEVIERELNEAELAQQKIDLENSQKYLESLEDIRQQKQALFLKLGITEDEAKLLLA